MEKTVLYIGGFLLPDRNAAAHRVVGLAKAMRQLGYRVLFLNALPNCGSKHVEKCEYYDFECYEYLRENQFSYLFTGDRAISFIKDIMPDYVVAYNYPAFALEKIVAFCKKEGIKCVSDVTEWYEPGGNIVRRFIKKVDVNHRMNKVLFKMDGIIAISKYLYEYYKKQVPTVLIPPTIDISDQKWHCDIDRKEGVTTFVYAGTPSAQKEKLDFIVDAIRAVEQRGSIRLNVIGITKSEYLEMYGANCDVPNCVSFFGKIDHSEVIRLVANADWAVIIRENSRLVRAGFPTKMVESISCGTPVIVNPFSNICDYLDDSNSIVTDLEDLQSAIEKACVTRRFAKPDQFDYHNFIDTIEPLFPRVGS